MHTPANSNYLQNTSNLYDVFCGQILQIYFCSTLVCLEAGKIINQDNGPSRGVQSITEDTEQPGALDSLDRPGIQISQELHGKVYSWLSN